MDLTKIDELDARQKALDEERAQARKAVLKEIQYLINRIDAKPEELTFPAGKVLTKRSRRSKKPDAAQPAPQVQSYPHKDERSYRTSSSESALLRALVFAHVQKHTPTYSHREKSEQSCAQPSSHSKMNICEREQVASMT